MMCVCVCVCVCMGGISVCGVCIIIDISDG